MSIDIDDLRRLAESGDIHTVRVSFADRLGNWRGKRVPVHQFLSSLGGAGAGPIGFCDGMLVADVVCDVIEETPYTNFRTGYPDFHMFLDGCDIRPVGWVEGEVFVFGRVESLDHEPVGVYPQNVLRAVVNRLAAQGVTATCGGTLVGRLMISPTQAVPIDRWPDGSAWGLLGEVVDGLVETGVDISLLESGRDEGVFRVSVAATDPVRLGLDLVVVKNAVREVATRGGLTVSFMTLPPKCNEPSTWNLALELSGLGWVDSERLAALLDQARPLLQPSTNAYKVGCATVPRIADGGTTTCISAVIASAEAEPHTAVAVALAAVAEAAAPCDAVIAPSSDWIITDARALAHANWLQRWLGREYLENSIPLLAREGELLRAAVTDLEVSRYWAFA